MLLHIRTHPSLAQQQVLFYLIEMDKMTGEPDYKQSTSRIGDSSSSASHSGNKRTDDSQAGGRGLREKKQRKQYGKNNDEEQPVTITTLKEAYAVAAQAKEKAARAEADKDAADKVHEANEKAARAEAAKDTADKVHDLQMLHKHQLHAMELQVAKAQPQEDLLTYFAKQAELNREAQLQQVKMIAENQTQLVQLIEAKASSNVTSVQKEALGAARRGLIGK